MLRLTGVLILFVSVVVVIARTAEESEEKGDLPRFSIVKDGLYRGGQPTAKGFQFLKQTGIKTIINLRAENNSESELVQGLGMNYVQIPVDGVRVWSVIHPAALAAFFGLVNNRANYPIFFHCLRGADRTGAFAAFYRMAIDRWDPARAYAEARDIGMRWFYMGLRKEIEDFRPPLDPAGLQTTLKSQ